MALIKCPECGSMISDNSKSCPQCGAPVIEAQTQYQQANNYQNTITQEDAQQPDPTCHTIGIILIGIGILDFCLGNFFGIDITGVWWSPIVLGFIGSSLMAVKRK